MIVALDVQYTEDTGKVAGVYFDTWTSERSSRDSWRWVTPIEPYVSGQFYKRELPCLLALLKHSDLYVDCVVIDGYVDTTSGCPGLGRHLYDALGQTTPVVGVAKTNFHGTSAVPVLRGRASLKPLFVTAAGMDVNEAAHCVQLMHGAHRIPTLLKRADFLARS